MKLKSIAAICRKKKYAVLFNDPEHDEQYVSVGAAVYKLEGLPFLTIEMLLRIFDVTEEEATKWFFDERPLPEFLCFANDCNERDIENIEEFPRLSWKGYDMLPLQVSNGIMAINAELLKPLEKSQYMRLFERGSKRGNYIAVKDGLELKALIMPLLPTDDLLDQLITLANGIRTRIADLADPETGEIEKQQTL